MKYIRHIKTKRYTTQTKNYAEYLCICGKTKVVRTDHIRSGRIKSCGCASLGINKTHGMSKTRVYRIWSSLLNRKNTEDKRLIYYKDIKICNKWRSFEGFFEDMGIPTTDKHEIDRIDPYGDYKKGNCRWATRTEQMLNQKRNYLIYKKYIESNPLVSYKLYRNRLTNGWDHVRAISTNKMKNQFI